jgi:NAD(P)-dependent dehydrogenase (short-subunit alcohol dehydrogenase family)
MPAQETPAARAHYDFTGRVAIVTGAAQGIGEAYARALAAAERFGGIDLLVTTRTVVGGMTDDIVKSLALKRMGQPQDLVGACLFLLSDEAGWITGQIFNVDGGQVFRS